MPDPITTKKRVVLAITLAEPGGAQSFVLGFARWLKAQGHEVTVVAGDGQWLADRCRDFGISFRRVASLGRDINLAKDWHAERELERIFRELKPDAIHLNSTKMGVLGSWAADSLQRAACSFPNRSDQEAVSCQLSAVSSPRIVYRIGGWVFLEPLSPLMKAIYLSIERFTARLKDVIVCVHPGDKAEAEARGIKPKEKIVVVPNGIDLHAFDAQLKSRDEARAILSESDPRSLITDHFVFGTLAHFYPAKDLVRYLEACALVHREAPQVKFVIVGDGPERQAIEGKRRELSLTDVVLLPGARDSAATLLRGFDAFVLPSAKEGMSWALLEAMAAGLPCVATDVGADRWMLGTDGGWIVPKQNPAALAQAMLAVMRDHEEAVKRGRTARDIVRTRFPLEQTYQGNADCLFTAR